MPCAPCSVVGDVCSRPELPAIAVSCYPAIRYAVLCAQNQGFAPHEHHLKPTKGFGLINIVLLSGGSGSRLWPLSNEARSKQFLKVLRDEEGRGQSMVQRTFQMIDRTGADANVVIATCASQKASIEAQVEGSYKMVIEPERRDTAPAIMLSSAFLALEEGVDPQSTVVVMPIDTFAEQKYYDQLSAIDEAVQSGVADLVLLGVEPTYPSEKFGYILNEEVDGYRRVTRFVEKPKMAAAAEMVSAGALWNCGVFGFKLQYLMDIVKNYHELDSFEQIRADYDMFPKISFDYEVVEKAKSVAVVPYSGTWKDLGTWNTLTEEMEDVTSGRVVIDSTCQNTHVVNETGLPMVVAGLMNTVVVATPDGILVSEKQRSANIKPLVAQAAETRPMYESRQWGEYSVLGQDSYESGQSSLEKILVVNPGRQLSYQMHHHRTEVWTIVDGEGEVVLDDKVIPVKPGSVVTIEIGQKHAVRAITKLRIFEVQMGTELVEEDIERFGFFWDAENYK